MTIKHYITTFFLLTLIGKINAQQVFDFYIPEHPFVVSTFCKNITFQNDFNLKRKIVYHKTDVGYDVISTKYENGDLRYVETNSIFFINNEVHLKEIFRKDNSGNITQRKYDTTNVVLLKIPPMGKTVSWTYPDINGKNISCTASWTSQNRGYSKVEIKPTPIIQVYKTTESKPSQIIIEFYQKNLGYAGTTKIDNEGEWEIIEHFWGGSSKE